MVRLLAAATKLGRFPLNRSRFHTTVDGHVVNIADVFSLRDPIINVAAFTTKHATVLPFCTSIAILDVFLCLSLSLYIYIERERGRERYRDLDLHTVCLRLRGGLHSGTAARNKQ